MIWISFDLSLPKFRFDILYDWEKLVTKNKLLEFQINRVSNLIGFTFGWRTKQSHAGITLELSLFTYEFMIHFVDRRHWDHELNCWEEDISTGELK